LLFPIQKTFSKDSGSNRGIYRSHVLNNKQLESKNFQDPRSFDTKLSFAIVTASALNLRRSPLIKNNILKVLLKNTHLITLTHPVNGWVKVRVPNEINGWVSKNYLKFYKPRALPFIKRIDNSTSFSSILEASIIEYMEEIYSHNKLNRNDKLSIVIQDLSSGEILASIYPRRIIKSASTIKVPILHAYVIQRFRGEIKESPWHKKLIEEMIRFSSNPSTNSIIYLLGGTDSIQKILYNTKIYKDLSLTQYFPVDGRAYQNKISAEDLNNLLVTIWFKLILNSKNNHQKNLAISEEMLHLLGLPGHAWLKDRIKAGTCFSSNRSVKIWDKTGFVKGVNGNAGIVEIDTPHGRKAYSIVLFIERKNYETIKGDAQKWNDRVSFHMRRISEITYAFFSNRYKSFFKCGYSNLKRYIKLALKNKNLDVSS